MSTLTVGTIQSNTTLPPVVENSAGTEIGTFCRAWVNFNGTGTVAIRGSFNVSSITDNGVGAYGVNLSTSVSDINGSVAIGGKPNIFGSYLFNASTVIINTASYTGVATDYDTVCCSIFR